jgi:hypothetical protein
MVIISSVRLKKFLLNWEKPDCKLIKPFELKKSISTEVYLESWNSDYSSQDTFMIHF